MLDRDRPSFRIMTTPLQISRAGTISSAVAIRPAMITSTSGACSPNMAASVIAVAASVISNQKLLNRR